MNTNSRRIQTGVSHLTHILYEITLIDINLMYNNSKYWDRQS